MINTLPSFQKYFIIPYRIKKIGGKEYGEKAEFKLGSI